LHLPTAGTRRRGGTVRQSINRCVKANKMMNLTLLLITLAIAISVLLVPSIVRAHEGHDHGAHARHEAQLHLAQPAAGAAEAGNYRRSLHAYLFPDLMLVNANARLVRLRDLLATEGPVVLDFMYTTCDSTCPVMSRELSMLPKKLGAEGAKLRMISISLDPEYDTPVRLKAYAIGFGAGVNWHFLTGSKGDIEELKRTFDVAHDSQTAAEAMTFLRPAPGRPWLRIDGFASADELARELRSVASR
jgi:protein SCO1/2